VLQDDTLRFCTLCGTPVAPAEPDAPAAVTVSVTEHVPLVATPAPAPAEDAVIIRRNRTSPFLPPRAPEEQVTPVVSRTWASQVSGTGKKKQLTRERKMAGDLPEWEPLPPGELIVTRGKRK
jgi:hypothetical protein